MNLLCKRFRLACVVLVPLFFVSQRGWAAGTVNGRVMDGESGGSLPGAVVVVQNSSLGAATANVIAAAPSSEPPIAPVSALDTRKPARSR